MDFNVISLSKMIGIIIQVCILLSLGSAQQMQVTELPAYVNTTICIPLKNLRNFTVQRGLGEARKIRKVQLYLIGNGNVDVSVGIATRFLDVEGSTKPTIYYCGEYQGSANDVMITFSCIEEGDEADQEGQTGYAVYAQFRGDVPNQPASVCQMDIVLHDKYAQQKEKNIQALAISIGVICGLIVITSVGVVIWYYWTKRRARIQEPVREAQYWEEELDDGVKSKKVRVEGLPGVEDDYDDEVFLK